MGDDIVILLTGGVSHIGTHVTAIPYEKDGSSLIIPWYVFAGCTLMILQGKKLSISAHGVKRIENI